MEIIGRFLNPEPKDPPLLRMGSDPSSSRSREEDFFDPKKRELETDEIFQQMEEAADFLQRTLSPEEKQEWHRVNSEAIQIVDSVNTLRDRIGKKSGGADNLFIINLQNIINATASIIYYNYAQRVRRIAKAHENTGQLQTLMQFSHFVGDLDVSLKVGGTSMLDILNSQKLPANAFYRSSVEAGIAVGNTSAFNNILQENQNPLTSMYPNETKYYIQRAITFFVAIADTSPELLESLIKFYIPNPVGKEQTVLKTARRIIEQASKTKKKILSTLLDPNSLEYEALRNTIMFYFSKKDRKTKTISMYTLGLNSIHTTSLAYRKAREVALQDNEHSPFYAFLARSIREYLEEIPEEVGILTNDDLPLFIDPERSIQEKSAPTLEDLRKLANAIFQKTSQRAWVINTEPIDWKILFPPTSVNAVFPKGHSRIFNISLSYENEQGEALSLDLEFDTAKNVFDWKPFLESPDDPEMKDMKNAVISSVRSILLEVEKQVDSEYQEQQRIKAVRALPLEPNVHTAKLTPKEEYVPRQKKERQKRQKLLTPLQEVLQNEISLPTEQVVKNQIVIPDMQVLGKKMGRLSPEDTLLVVNGIEEYNQRGVGQFKRLRFSGEERKPLFTLRVNCGAGGGIRVLMHEIPNPTEESNLRAFEIVDIDYRKNIYRKRGL